MLVPLVPRRAGRRFCRCVANQHPKLSDEPGVGLKAMALLGANGRTTFPDLLSLFRDHTDEHGAGGFIDAPVGFGVMKRWAKVVSASLSYDPF